MSVSSKRKIPDYDNFSRGPVSKHQDVKTLFFIFCSPDDKPFQKGWPSFETTAGLLFVFRSVELSELFELSELWRRFLFRLYSLSLSEFYLLICSFDCLSFERSQCRNLGGNWLTTVCLSLRPPAATPPIKLHSQTSCF